MAAKQLKPETVAKKLAQSETLPDFLARMTVVWEERQVRVAQFLARSAENARRYIAKRKAEDPEAWAVKRREAAKRYVERHPDRIAAKAERDRLRKARLAFPLAAAKAILREEKLLQREADKARQRAQKAAEQGKRAEGYPKRQTKSQGDWAGASTPKLQSASDVSRGAWLWPASAVDARPENGGSPAL
jgi:hypothetical protein